MDNDTLEQIQNAPHEIRVALFATLFYMIDKSNAGLPITFETIKIAARICAIDPEYGARLIKDGDYKALVEGLDIPLETQKLMSLAALTLFPMDIGGDEE